MKSIQKIIDVNAHIENLKCKIDMENGMAVARISFDNLGIGNITAIKFNACGYNSFGDTVQINGKDNFFLIIQDINIGKNEFSKDLKAKLPNADIKMLKLTESQICYDDGSVISYDGESVYTFEIDEFEINADREQLNALKKVYDERMKYIPKAFEQGWICGCGRFNKIDSAICSRCLKSKTDTMRATSSDGLKKIIEKYREQENEEHRIAQEQAKQKAKDERNKKLGIAAGIVCIIAFVAFLINASIMSKRETYSSVDEMRSAMQGTWSHDGYNSVLWQIQIDGDTCTRKYEPDDEGYQGDITWNPAKGTFTVRGTTYIVQKGGRSLMEGNYDYRRGGTLTSSKDYSSNSYESVYSALRISDISVTSNSSYTVCTGTITNNGKNTYKFVQIKGAFKDSSGNVLDTDSTYGVGSEGLAPGESTTFRMSIHKNSSVTDCSVSIYDYDD